jgi:hypothetical protein
MHIDRGRLPLAAALVLCLALVLAGPAAAKKKKKRGPATTPVNVTKAVNLPIPDATPGGTVWGSLTSTIDVTGKQLNGRVIKDVNVTVQTLGTSGANPSNDLIAMLRAPNGTWITLFTLLQSGTGDAGQSIGPLTLDDEAPFDLGGGNHVNPNLLYSPWLGTATPGDPFTPLFPIRYYLSELDEGAVSGTWLLRVFDLTNTETSNLVSWSINATAGRPFKVKGK